MNELRLICTIAGVWEEVELPETKSHSDSSNPITQGLKKSTEVGSYERLKSQASRLPYILQQFCIAISPNNSDVTGEECILVICPHTLLYILIRKENFILKQGIFQPQQMTNERNIVFPAIISPLYQMSIHLV